MINKLNNTILDLKVIASSIFGELVSNYPFIELIKSNKKKFIKELTITIRNIVESEITLKGSKYLRSKITHGLMDERVLALCKKFKFSKEWSDIVMDVTLENLLLDSLLKEILSHIEPSHYEIWVVSNRGGIYVISLINDIRIQEWEEGNCRRPIPF